MSGEPLQEMIACVDRLSLPAGTHVLIAASGGPHSTALALSFRTSTRPTRAGWVLRIGHVNHTLRGADSDADEAFVRSLGARLDLPVQTTRVDTRRYALEHRLSIETAARELRHAALRAMLDRWDGGVVAVGHHLEDRAETVLMNLIRGAGIDGLTSMAATGGGIVRPFLDLSGEGIRAALDAAGEPYRLDESNLRPDTRRNKLRLQILPAIEEIQPRARHAVARSAASLSLDRAYLDGEAAQALQLLDMRSEPTSISAAVGSFRAVHAAIQTRVLRLLIQSLLGSSRDISGAQLRLLKDTIVASHGHSTLAHQLPHGMHLTVSGGRFSLSHREPDGGGTFGPMHLRVPGAVQSTFGRFEATVSGVGAAASIGYDLAVCGPCHAFCDADRLGDRLLVRPRSPGDRLSLARSSGSRKVQDLLVDAKVPRSERDRVPILQNDVHLVWIPGIGVDRRVIPTDHTKRVAHLRFRAFL